jgi:hypothetical protein
LDSATPLPLEPRIVLSGPQATWLGQDGRDLVGPYAANLPDGIQDVHIAISDIDPARQIIAARLQGLGGSQWIYNLPGNSWHAALEKGDSATSASLYVQPDRVETGRPFNLVLTFDDASTADLWFDGGAADPTLRAAELIPTWLGQTGDDLTGTTPAVGPDGLQDAVIALAGLAAPRIVSVDVSGPDGLAWSYGTNPHGRDNAELVRDTSDANQGRLYISPDRDLAGATLNIEVVYETGRIDTTQIVAGTTNPGLGVAAPTPLPPRRSGTSAAWLGQVPTVVTSSVDHRGWAALAVDNLPAGRSVVGATLADAVTSWVYRAAGQSSTSYYGDPYALPLAFQADASNPARGLLAFPPVRDESGAVLSLRLTFDDGSVALADVSGGAVDLSRLSATPSPNKVVAAPGADLNALARVYGSIELSPGIYRLETSLVLEKPVAITAPQGGVTLVFAQPASDQPWTAAIKVHAGNTSLSGFAVRFDGPVRWNWAVNYGPALIGVTDNFDSRHSDPKANLSFTNLDIESPAPAAAGEEAPRIMRLVGAAGGIVANNMLKGGAIEFDRGPWVMTGNTYLGTVPGTWSWDVFAGHFTHDLTLSDNQITPLPDSGVTYRFLVLTGSGTGDRIERNSVTGLGAHDPVADTVNARELVLTEAYSLRFEGRPLALSSDGRILQIPKPQGDAPSTGDVVAVVSGAAAGSWARVAQALSPTTLVLDRPLPATIGDVSIASGFVGDIFADNTIDASGTHASSLVLLGAQFDTTVRDNTITGGVEAIRSTSFPSERPMLWGWSHTPVFGLEITGNSLVDPVRGIVLGTEHGGAVKTSKGRVYETARVTDNTIRWSDDFANPASADARLPHAIVVGDARSLEPAETRVTLSRNTASRPAAFPDAGKVQVFAAEVNDKEIVDSLISLPLPPPTQAPSVTLAHDTGSSDSDLSTRDATIALGSVAGAVVYEYSVGGAADFRPAAGLTFLPVGVVEGSNTITVRGVNADGLPGPSATFTFVLDTTPPIASLPLLDAASDTGQSASDGLTSLRTLTFLAVGEAGDQVVLYRDGKPVARGLPGTIVDPGPVPQGRRLFTLQRTDAAGNVSTSTATTVTVDITPPPAVVVSSTSSDGRIVFVTRNDDWRYEYRVGKGSFQAVATPGSFVPAGLLFGANRVELRAIDPAGNPGPATRVSVNLVPSQVAGMWLGQDNHDYVGPYPVAVPDGIQDIHIQLGGLPPNKDLTFVDVQGLGGSRWQYGIKSGHWRIVMTRSKGSTTADLYLQADRYETGRPFEIKLGFKDGSTAGLWVTGGTADPTLPVRPMPAAQQATLSGKVYGQTPIGPRLAKWIARWRSKNR